MKTNNITMKRSEKLISYAESIGVKDYFLIGEDWINPKRKLSPEPFEDLKGLINQNPNYDSILCQDHKTLMRKPDFFNKLTRLLQEKNIQMHFAATSDSLFDERFIISPTYAKAFNSINLL
jgi:hypothetical protein